MSSRTDEDPEQSIRSRSGSSETRVSDERLMERVRGGDRAAFSVLVDRYWAPLVVFAEGFVHRREVARDLVQEAFVNVWERREHWTSSGSVSAFFYQIARNLAINERRRRRHQKEWAERSGPDLFRAHLPETPAEALASEALRRRVEEAIEALPPRRREVFVLARFHGLSYREIAASMGVARQTVANQMSAALSSLRKALSDQVEPG